MAILSSDQRPKKRRTVGVTKYERSADWPKLKLKLKHGQPVKGGFIGPVYSDEELKALDIGERTISRFLQGYLNTYYPHLRVHVRHDNPRDGFTLFSIEWAEDK